MRKRQSIVGDQVDAEAAVAVFQASNDPPNEKTKSRKRCEGRTAGEPPPIPEILQIEVVAELFDMADKNNKNFLRQGDVEKCLSEPRFAQILCMPSKIPSSGIVRDEFNRAFQRMCIEGKNKVNLVSFDTYLRSNEECSLALGSLMIQREEEAKRRKDTKRTLASPEIFAANHTVVPTVAPTIVPSEDSLDVVVGLFSGIKSAEPQPQNNPEPTFEQLKTTNLQFGGIHVGQSLPRTSGSKDIPRQPIQRSSWSKTPQAGVKGTQASTNYSNANKKEDYFAATDSAFARWLEDGEVPAAVADRR